MQQQNIDMMHGYLAGVQFDPIEMVFTELLDQESGQGDPQPEWSFTSTDHQWKREAIDVVQWGGHRQPALDDGKYPSVDDLVSQFNQDHADRQAERFLALLEASVPEQPEFRREMEEADQWAESVRLRLEALTTDDLRIIQQFSEAVKNGDSEKVDQTVDSFQDSARYMGSVLTALGLTP